MATRFVVAGALLFALAGLRGATFPTRATEWAVIALLGVLNNALYLGLTAVALLHLSAGTGASLASTNPLLVALAAAVFLGERLTALRTGGLLLSFAGVAWIMWTRVGAHDRPEAMALFLGCTLFMVTATLLFKGARLDADLLVVNAGQCLTGGLVLTVPMLLVDDVARIRLTPALLAAQIYLVITVACIAMLLWFWLLRHGGAARASAYFFLNPVLALVLGEAMTARDVMGAAAVALGIYLVQRA
jgi:drug/metabolite transporter (DMT)-like permease